jgi:hypothetical protein
LRRKVRAVLARKFELVINQTANALGLTLPQLLLPTKLSSEAASFPSPRMTISQYPLLYSKPDRW